MFNDLENVILRFDLVDDEKFYFYADIYLLFTSLLRDGVYWRALNILPQTRNLILKAWHVTM